MRTIYKYDISGVFGGDVSVVMPKRSKVLSVQYQGTSLCVWAAVRTGFEVGWRKFSVFGTGQEVPDRYLGWEHVGTVQQGSYVWHIFASPEGPQ